MMLLLKKLHSLSVIAALVAALATILQCLLAGFGGQCLPFGGVVLPVAYFAGLLIGYPLLVVQKNLALSKTLWLLIYWATALLGVVLVFLSLGFKLADILQAPISTFQVYGISALLSASAAWYFAVYWPHTTKAQIKNGS